MHGLYKAIFKCYDSTGCEIILFTSAGQYTSILSYSQYVINNG